MIESIIELEDYTPEEKMYAAILRVAIEDLKNPKYREQSAAFFLRKDQDYFGSFSHICTVLQLNEDHILNDIKDYYFYGINKFKGFKKWQKICQV